jgi:hypothetical protein
VFADEELFAAIERDGALAQLLNVATLPGIVGAALVMPDANLGYGSRRRCGRDPRRAAIDTKRSRGLVRAGRTPEPIWHEAASPRTSLRLSSA